MNDISPYAKLMRRNAYMCIPENTQRTHLYKISLILIHPYVSKFTEYLLISRIIGLHLNEVNSYA